MVILKFQVWELLNYIPTSEKLFNEMSQLSEKWESLLDSSSTFKLIYSLQIIEMLISDDLPSGLVV